MTAKPSLEKNMKMLKYIWNGVTYWWAQWFGPKTTIKPIKIDEILKGQKDLENFFRGRFVKEEGPKPKIVMTDTGELISTNIEQYNDPINDKPLSKYPGRDLLSRDVGDDPNFPFPKI